MDTSFAQKVYEITRQIPKGMVATYGQIARLAGKTGAARAVGHYMKINPYAPNVPCHRVVGSNGSLTGYSMKGGLISKKKLLKEEGVIFDKDKVNLSKSQWKEGVL
ncbi:MAG: MGMT family protein [Microgenomates group bacterium]